MRRSVLPNNSDAYNKMLRADESGRPRFMAAKGHPLVVNGIDSVGRSSQRL